jgi:hypothetical protein
VQCWEIVKFISFSEQLYYKFSVAAPGYFFPIPDTTCFHPRSRILIFPSRICIKEFLTQKMVSKIQGNMIRFVHPGSGSWLFTHPGSRGQKGTGSRIRICKTVQILFGSGSSTLCMWLFWSLAFVIIPFFANCYANPNFSCFRTRSHLSLLGRPTKTYNLQ